MPPNEVGEAFIAIRATTSQFAEEARTGVTSSLTSAREQANVPVRMTVDKASEGSLKRDVGSVVKNVAAYAGGLFAVAKVFDFGKEVVQEAAAVQKAEESIRSEYGKSAEAAVAFAHGQATSMGISAAASETASAKVGALLRNLGETPAVASRNNLALQRTVGLMSEMKNIDPATVLARLNTTLATGSTRGLRDLGVALDSTTVKAEAMRAGLIKTSVDQGVLAKAQYNYAQAQKTVTDLEAHGKKGTDDYRKAVIQQTLAHEALGKAIAGTSGPLTVAAKDQAIINLVTAHSSQLKAEAAKHSGDLAVQERVLSATWANMKATLGEELLPVVTSFFHELIHGVQLAKEYKTELIGVVGVLAGASALWAAVTVATKTWTAATEIATGAQKILSGNIVFSEGALASQKAAYLESAAGQEAYSAAIAAGATETEAATVATEGMNTALLANPIGLVIGAVAVLAFGLYELYHHSETARRIMNETWKDLKHYGLEALHVVTAGVRWAVAEGRHLWSEYGNDVKMVWGEIKRFVTTGIHAVEDVIRIGDALIHGEWGKAWAGVKQLAHDVWPEIKHLVRLGVSGLLDLGGWIFDQAKKLGVRIVKGAISGVGSLAGDLKSTLEHKIGSALSSLNPFSPVEHGAQMYIADPIIKGTAQGLDPFQGELQGAIIPTLQRVLGRAQTVGVQQGQMLGTDITRNTINATHGLSTGLGSAIIAGAQAALAHARSALGIHSPSSLFARGIGEPLAEGIIHGLGGLEAGLTKKLISSVQASMSAVGGSFGGVSPQGSSAIGANQILGREMMLAAGWPASQWGALQALWNRESGWNANAVNPSSGAAGIPQALGHGHVFNLGDARAQIAWGLDYIRGRYGSPSAAWAHETAVGWYDRGGVVPGPLGAPQPAVVHGGEVVFTADQMRMLTSKGIHVDQLTIVSPGGGEAAEMFLNHIVDRA